MYLYISNANKEVNKNILTRRMGSQALYNTFEYVWLGLSQGWEMIPVDPRVLLCLETDLSRCSKTPFYTGGRELT